MLRRLQGFGDLSVPAVLVNPMRALFNAQGADPGAVHDDGTIDPMGLVTLAYNKITFNSAVTGPIPISLVGPSDPATIALAKKIQPALIFDGPAGHLVLAPQGEPGGILPELKAMGWELGVGLGLAVLGLLFVGAAMFGGRARAKAKVARSSVSGYRRRRVRR